MGEPAAKPGADGRLPPVVKSLGVVSFFNDLASEMVYPLLPAFLTRGLGAGALALGVLDGVADAVSAGVKLGAGWLSDRPRWRRPLVVGGYLVAAVTRPLMGLAGAAWQVISLRAVDRVGKGARNPPRDAVIADAVDAGLRGRAFGFHRAMDHAGAMVGPLVASAMIAGFALAPREVILWSVVPGVLATAVAAVALKRVELGERGERPASAAPVSARPAPSRTLMTLIILYSAARMPEALLLLRVQDLGVPLALIPVLWALLHVVRSAASYPGGWLSDHAGPARTLVLGWLLYAAVAAGLAVSASTAGAALWFLAFGLVAAATESPERALVAAWAGPGARGRGYGLYHAGVGLVALPGGVALGALYQVKGGATALAVSAAVGLAAAGVGALPAWRRRPTVGGPDG